MKKTILTTLFIFVSMISTNAQSFFGDTPLAHTFSIVAFDPKTGDMGVAVQSHWFSTGTVVSWGEGGVGVVATQSFANPAFGPEGLALLKKGLSPTEALDSLIHADDGRDFRQVAFLNSKGEVSAYTGKQCIEAAGHIEGKHYSVQANMMLNDEVVPAMAKAFEQAEGALADRLVAALEGAQAAGGDIRGKQSAAVLVVRSAATATGKVWEDRIVDLRVDDHAEPIQEIKRLLGVHYAFQHMNAGDVAVEKGDLAKAKVEYEAAGKLLPDHEEVLYWQAVMLINEGEIAAALPMFATVFKKNENWRTLTPRLLPNGLLKVDEATLALILKQ